jgi:CheY-like chemotaxis protein
VLVVDDHPDVRAYVRSILAPAFRVAEATTGAEGLEQARALLPDVILADVMMPEMDGLEMTRRLRADARTAPIPVVMLTARAGADDEVEGLAAGATDYVLKPFDAQVLEMRVRGTLAYQARLRRHLLQALRTEADVQADGAEVRADRPTDDDPTGDGPTNDGLTDTAPAGDAPAEGAPAEDALADPFERRMRAAIVRHLPDPDFDATALAEALALSRSTLYRRARQAEAPSPAALIRTLRLERGAELLAQGAGTVSEVAYAVGFHSLSHFSDQFAAHFGTPPTGYAVGEGRDDAEA